MENSNIRKFHRRQHVPHKEVRRLELAIFGGMPEETSLSGSAQIADFLNVCQGQRTSRW